ncbi:hypothetical protein ACG83_30385 [Frankia sp. R43]|nr:hypothetical protein ACG83_30385 [Frankia sp. R43]
MAVKVGFAWPEGRRSADPDPDPGPGSVASGASAWVSPKSGAWKRLLVSGGSAWRGRGCVVSGAEN